MFNIFSKLLDLNAREVNRLDKVVKKINDLESKYKKDGNDISNIIF